MASNTQKRKKPDGRRDKVKLPRGPKRLDVQAGSTVRQDRRVARRLVALDRRYTAWCMYIDQDKSETDIGKALGVTQARISQYLTEAYEERAAEIGRMSEVARVVALERVGKMRQHWKAPAAKNAKAAEVLLRWEERGDKLNGLYVNKSEVTGANGGPLPVNSTSIDIDLLDAEELMWLERIVTKAQPAASR
jgi:hypothetical protein